MSGSMLLNNASLGSELQSLLMCDGIVPGAEPSYQVCKTIYLYHPIGGKLAEAPIELAQSQARKIAVQDGPEDRLNEAFVAEWERIGADHYIFTTAALARVYGIASLIMGAVGVNAGEPIDPFKFPDLDLFFNCLDPLNTAGSLVLDQNPNSPNFQRPTTITVAGTAYHPSRAVVMLNGPPIYIAYTGSGFGFVGRSVYQRALFPLKTYVSLVQAVNLLAVKLGVIVAKMKQGGTITDAIMQRSSAQKREFIKEAATGNVLSISTDEDIETLDLQNADKVLETALRKNLEMIASAAPMPAKLLNQETFAEGFGEGTEDAKVIVRYVNRIRAELTPLYRFFDKIVQHRAWSPIFYRAIQNDFPEYRGVPYETAFYSWQESFSAEWPSLLEEPDSEKVKVSETKLRAITSMVEVFLPNADPDNKARVLQWAADNLNAEKQMFTAPLELDWEALAAYEPAAASGMPGQDAPGADALGQTEPAPPQPEGLARGDAAPLPADHHWITTETGSHILVDGEGTVVAGAGGALTGRSLSSFGGAGKKSSDAPVHRDVEPAPSPQHAAAASAEPRQMPAKKNNFVESDKSALESYTLAGSYPINDFLRNGTEVEKGRNANATHLRTSEDVNEAIRNLDETFEKASLPEAMTVYRGVDDDAWKRIQAQAKDGGLIKDAGFVSTAKDKKGVAGSSLTHWMTIQVPKGYPAIDMDATGARNRTNGEILLDRGTKFRVVKMTRSSAVLEVVPEEARGDSADLVRMDKAPLPADQHWITTETGSHILVDGSGTVVAGAGGALTGRSLSSFGGGKKSADAPSLGLGFGKGAAPAHRAVDPVPTPQQEGLGLAEPPKPAARPVHHAEAEIRAILGGNASPEQVAKLAALFGAARPAAPIAKVQKAWTPTGTEIEARPEVVDLGDLTTSNDDDGKVNSAFPQHLQPRDRSTAASQSQIRSLAGRLNPELLAPSPLTSSGAPIVGPDGVVESGNGRTMALRKVLTDPAFAAQRERYVEYLKGQGHNVEGMKNPVLVMRRTSPMTDAQRRQFVVEANERTTLGMGAAEQAKSDADRAGANIDKWQGSDAGSASNAAFARGFMSTMSPEERGAMLDKDGSLSADGERRIQSAVTAHAYGEKFGPILDKFLGGTNDGMKAIANGMAEAAGPWAQLRKASAAGTIPPHLDITKDLASAVETVARARQLGRPVKELLDQTDLDRAPLSPVAHSLLSAFYQNDTMKRPASKDAVAGVLSRYAELAAKVSPAPDMFGTPPSTAGQVLKDALANPSRHDAAAEFCQDAADDAEWYAAHGMAGELDIQQEPTNA